MSTYNGNIKTTYIDPIFDNVKFRTEWKLPSDSVLLSNMRLLDIGITANTGTDLNPLVGAYPIRSIQLYDGNVLLDQQLEASIFKGFQNFNNTNDNNVSVENTVSRNALGFVASGETDWQNGRPDKNNIKVQRYNSRSVSGETSWCNIKAVLPFLTSSLVVPTSVYKNLKLVVNWKTPNELRDLVVDRSDPGLICLANSFLAVDEIVSDEAKKVAEKNYKGVVYRAIENDSVFVPQINPPVNGTLEQDNSFLMNGFNNKSLERVVIVQTPLDQSTYTDGTDTKGVGNQGSMPQWNTEYQLRVNGSNKLSRNGFTKRNQRLAQLTDSWGECNLPTGNNFTYFPGMVGKLSTDIEQGQLDYTALKLNEKVNELVVDMKRTGVDGNAKLNQPLRLNVFGEVVKSVYVNPNGTYTVSYI